MSDTPSQCVNMALGRSFSFSRSRVLAVEHKRPLLFPLGTKKKDQDLTVTEISTRMVEDAARDFQEIPLENLSSGSPLPADCYLPRLVREENRIVMSPVASLGHVAKHSSLEKIRQAGFSALFVPKSQMADMLPYLNASTREILNNNSIPMVKKARVIYDNAFQIVAQAMSSKELGSSVRAGSEYVSDVVGFVRHNPQCLKHLNEMLAMDYSLFTHAVNVGLLLIAFGSKRGMNARDITTLGLGGLFHDIGKRDTPIEILNKPGPLDETEWKIIRRHPTDGVRLLRDNGRMPLEAYQMVHQHHENLDGTGYPQGLTQADIAAFSQIIRIVDTYDALTSTRVYKGAVMAGSAVSIMAREMSAQINKELFSSFVVFLGSVAKE